MKKFIIILLFFIVCAFVIWQFFFKSSDQPKIISESAPPVYTDNITTVTLPILEKEESKQEPVPEFKKQADDSITSDEMVHFSNSMPESSQQIATVCDDLIKEVEDMLVYLNQTKYLRDTLEEESIKNIFGDALNRLAKNQPMPVGEGKDSDLMIKNIFHFFRQLDDIQINTIKLILKHEFDDIEFFADTMFRWLTIGKNCLNIGTLKPFSKDVFYIYACFFLNTTGGRAYLSRLTPPVRQLTAYYSTLAVYQADKEGYNIFAIDVVPHITSLILEIKSSNVLHMKDQYEATLSSVLEYYALRRTSIN